MCIASVMELAGTIGVGARVADTIRTKIVKVDEFADSPGVLMLGMVCTVVASSSWLIFATKIGFPVSTTHTVLGGVLGMGIAAVGANGISWVGKGSGTELINSGVVSVFMAWIIAPCLSGIFSAILFTITKYLVHLRKDPVKWAFFLIPFYFGMTASLLTTLLLTKGGTIKSNLSDDGTSGVIVGVGVGVAIMVAIFWLPWLWRVVVKGDWQLNYFHVLQGPLLLKRGEVPPPPDNHVGIINYYEGHLTQEELDAKRAAQGGPGTGDDLEIAPVTETNASGEKTEATVEVSAKPASAPRNPNPPRKPLVGPKPVGSNFSPKVIFWWVRWLVFRGVDLDIVALQKGKNDFLAGDLEQAHAGAQHYDNNVEHMYSYLQVMTAATASFTHGANDAANAVGPYATIYQIWASGVVPGKGADIPLWILGFLGAAIVVGLWTYGYKIMTNLGNRITLISPSRGFSMELGSAITIIMATRFGLPISTTQCITGGTVGVGLCNGDWRTINWRMVAWIYFGWFVTVPVAGILSGCLMGIILNAPRWGLP
jgi:solute carrier family 20 (sodium-dependent phosphate transporter)